MFITLLNPIELRIICPYELPHYVRNSVVRPYINIAPNLWSVQPLSGVTDGYIIGLEDCTVKVALLEIEHLAEYHNNQPTFHVEHY